MTSFFSILDFLGANENEIFVEMNCFGSGFDSGSDSFFSWGTSFFWFSDFFVGLKSGSLVDKSTPLLYYLIQSKLTYISLQMD